MVWFQNKKLKKRPKVLKLQIRIWDNINLNIIGLMTKMIQILIKIRKIKKPPTGMRTFELMKTKNLSHHLLMLKGNKNTNHQIDLGWPGMKIGDEKVLMKRKITISKQKDKLSTNLNLHRKRKKI